jgi:hypothetical protein
LWMLFRYRLFFCFKNIGVGVKDEKKAWTYCRIIETRER